MTGLLQDARLALRSLVKNRGFAAAAGLALALGIGPNTALFSVLHAVLLRPLPYPEPERLVVVWETMHSQRSRVTPPDLVDWKAESRSFSKLAAREEAPFTLTVGDAPERTEGARVSGDYFALLGIVPRVGRGGRRGWRHTTLRT